MGTRVLHLVPAIPFGGMQRFVAWLAAEQISQGIDATVIMLYDDIRLREALIESEVPFRIVGGRRPSFKSAVQLGRILRELSPHIVHLHAALLWVNVCGLLYKDSPWIYHAHSYCPTNKTIKDRLIDWSLSWLCTARIAVSKSVADDQEANSKRDWKTFVVPNGVKIDVEAQKTKIQLRDVSCVFGFASRLTRDKGLDAFTRVCADIISHEPRAHFLVAGDGVDSSKLREELASTQLSKHFTLLGHVEDMDSFWSSIDVFLFVAPRDTFGLTIVEAMIRGVPVAAFRTCSGSAEILVNGENALLAADGDSQGLAQCALRLIQEPELRARIKRNAFESASQNFTIAKCARRISDVYSSVRPDIFNVR